MATRTEHEGDSVHPAPQFLLHALALTVAGLAARGNPLFRRFLAFQGVVALLILPVVFLW